MQFVANSLQSVETGDESVNLILSPMSCRVSSVKVKLGDVVKTGETLMIVEAMKMEHLIKAPRGGIVKKVHYSEGQLVGEKKSLVELGDQ